MKRRIGVTVLVFVAFVAVVWFLLIPEYGPGRRRVGPLNACWNNLRAIDGAIESIAVREQLPTNSVIPVGKIERALAKGFPKCPSGGRYDFGIVGREPSCSVHSERIRAAVGKNGL